MKRKAWLLAIATLLIASGVTVAADEMKTSQYPDHPITLVVPFPGGHPTDITARRDAPKLAEALHQPVNVENRPGPSGTTALAMVAHAKPDGYTLIIHGVNGLAIAPHVMKVDYNPITDFAPIMNWASVPMLLVVNRQVPVATVQDLIAYAKSNPDKLTAGSFGAATNSHLALVLFNRNTGLKIPHTAYPGGAQTTADLISGKFQLMFDFPGVALSKVRAGELRALAVTSDRRLAVLPDVPTFAEAGVKDMEITGWQGYLAPAGTPPEIITRLNAEIQKILNSSRQVVEATGNRAEGGTPDAFATFIKSEYERWGKLIKDEGIRLE